MLHARDTSYSTIFQIINSFSYQNTCIKKQIFFCRQKCIVKTDSGAPALPAGDVAPFLSVFQNSPLFRRCAVKYQNILVGSN